jgi:hypothetical protein
MKENSHLIRVYSGPELTVNLQRQMAEKEQLGHNISYPSSAGSVVYAVHLSARASFRLDRKSHAIHPCV